MDGVRKLARSQSVKVSEMLKLPSTVERSVSDSKVEEEMAEDSDKPTLLPILRVAGHTGTKEQKRVKEEREKSNGAALPSTGLLCYSDLLHLLTCPACSCLVSPPVSQCRKGHLYCRDCRTSNSCRICKHTFLEAPNIALETIMGLIALPCRYGPQGCPSSVFLPTRLHHETVCQFRPVNCQFHQLGCQMVFPVKDMSWHHKMCQYADHPQENMLPCVPARHSNTDKQDVTLASDDGKCVAAQDLQPDTDNGDKCNVGTAVGCEN